MTIKSKKTRTMNKYHQLNDDRQVEENNKAVHQVSERGVEASDCVEPP